MDGHEASALRSLLVARSFAPITIALPAGPRPRTSRRFAFDMFFLRPPMYVSSTSTGPGNGLSFPSVKPSRMRCIRNHAPFDGGPMETPSPGGRGCRRWGARLLFRHFGAVVWEAPGNATILVATRGRSRKMFGRARRRTSPIPALGAAVALLGLSGGALAEGMPVKIGFATVQDPQHRIGEILADRLNKRSGGKLAARIFPGGQLGKIARMIEGIQLGTQELLIAPPGFLVGHNAAFQVPDAPGVFKDVWHAHRALNDPAFREPYSKLALGTGIRVLSLYVYGPTSFASLRPIRTLDDFKGKKIRVLASKMETALVGKLGATGVPMSYIEVLPGLSRKTIDGVRSSIIVMGGSKFFTVTKYITVVESGQIPSAIFASEAWLKKLPADLLKLVVDTTSGMGDECTRIGLEFGARAEKLWKDNGAEVIRLSAADQAEFMNRVRTLGDDFLGKHDNPQVREMYGLLKASIKRNEK